MTGLLLGFLTEPEAQADFKSNNSSALASEAGLLKTAGWFPGPVAVAAQISSEVWSSHCIIYSASQQI